MEDEYYPFENFVAHIEELEQLGWEIQDAKDKYYLNINRDYSRTKDLVIFDPILKMVTLRVAGYTGAIVTTAELPIEKFAHSDQAIICVTGVLLDKTEEAYDIFLIIPKTKFQVEKGKYLRHSAILMAKKLVKRRVKWLSTEGS